MKLTNVSNPAAFGVEWAGESGTRYQLANARGSAVLMFGAKRAHGEWVSTPVTAPERFGMRRPPESMAEFLAIAEAFTADAG